MYDELPWLNLYDEGRPRELELDDESMLSAFRRTATRVPDRTATLYFDTPISYRELDRLTDALAAGLRAEGFDPGERLASTCRTCRSS